MNWKRPAARVLRNLSSTLADHGLKAAESLDPILPPATEPERRARTEAMLARLDVMREHPCPRCRGQGALIVSAGSDTVVCPLCQGMQVDPVALMFGADFLGDGLEGIDEAD